jgi:hypothetical protein
MKPKNETIEKLICADCGNETTITSSAVINCDVICDECNDDHYCTCDQCGTRYNTNDLGFSTDDHCFCDWNCAREYGIRECQDCDEYFNSHDEGQRLHDGHYVCDHCANDYFTCNDCGSMFHQDYEYYVEEEGCSYCDECYHHRRQEDNEIIHDYGYKPQPQFFKMAWENTLFLGLEIELECGNNMHSTDTAKKMKQWLIDHKCDKKCYFKYDGSLSNGIEIVFHPFTLQSYHKDFPLSDFIKYCRSIGLSGYNPNTCGIHIHLSKTHFKKNGLYIGKLFFYKCQKYLKQFSKRKDYNFCKFDQVTPENEYSQENGRYSALNNTSKTMEIRIFRSTTNYNRILASMQFADAFANYCNQTSIKKMMDGLPSLIWQDFIKFAKKSGRYSHFIKYIFIHKVI